MRTYEKTHRWLTFQIDLPSIPMENWLLLGEARSKSEHLAGVPLQPATAEKLHRLYLAKGALATTAIEGNTLSTEQVEQYLEGKLVLPPSKRYLEIEVANVVSACSEIFSKAQGEGAVPLTTETICGFNHALLAGLDLPDEIRPGKIREHNVGVADYRGAPHEDVRFLLDRLTSWLDQLQLKAPPAMGLAMPILRAILAHIYVAWIHPFGDGNGRTARLVEFTILVNAGVPTPAAHLLSNHYNETRSEYYRQLQHASRSGGDVMPFVRYALQGFVDGLKEQIERVREQQLDVAWENFVHEQFKHDDHSNAKTRQKHLLLDLSAKSAPVPLTEIRVVSGRVATEYAQKTTKTIMRDLNELTAMDLIERTSQGYRAKKETIRAFLPKKVTPKKGPTSRDPNAPGGTSRAAKGSRAERTQPL